MQAFSRAEKVLKPPIQELFRDVYKEVPKHLQAQSKECMEHIAKYPHEYPTENFAKDDWAASAAAPGTEVRGKYCHLLNKSCENIE